MLCYEKASLGVAQREPFTNCLGAFLKETICIHTLLRAILTANFF